MRVFTSLLLLCSLFALPPAASAADLCSAALDADSGISVVQEAYNLLSVLFVDRLPAQDLLEPALEAVVPTEQNIDPSTVIAAHASSDQVSDWSVFAGQYCAAWSASAPDSSVDMSHTAIRAMARAVDEGHTRFLTPTMYQDHQAWASGDVRYDGIGARLRGNPLGVQYVFPGSPAEEAGLLYGDDIVAIDGEAVAELSAAEAVRLVRGETGTVVRLTVERPGVVGSWDVDVARASVQLPVIEARSIQGFGYLRLQGFPTTDLPAQVHEALRSFEQSGTPGLILDLRGNAGGRLDVGTAIASYFLPPATPVFQQTTRRGQSTTATAAADRTWDRPMVVLVDEVTASMGEILAAALQEEHVATVVGATTSGTVAGSIVVPLADGSALQVTTLRIKSGQGAALNNVGVHPDVPVQPTVADAQAGRDTALDAAVGLLEARLANGQSSGMANAPAAAATVQPAGAALPTP